MKHEKELHGAVSLYFSILLALAAQEISFAQSLTKYTEANADAIYLDVQHEFILNKDGSMEYNYEHALKLLSSFAYSRQYGESFVVYNPKWQELKVTKSTTTMSSGTEVSSPFNAFNEVLPGFAHGAAPYAGLREMVVTHTGLEENAVIHFAYSLKTKPGMLPGLMNRMLFGGRCPIRKMTVRVKVPAGIALHSVFFRSDMKPVETSQMGMDVYTWQQENLPMMPVEENQPPMDEYLPVLYFTTASFEDVYTHILSDEADLMALEVPMKSVVKSVLKDASSPRERALAIRNFVEKNVGLMNGDPLYLGYKPMTARETFSRNVGSKVDRSILLTALLREAGLHAYPVLFSRNNTNNEQQDETKFACLQLFSEMPVLCDGIGQKNASVLLNPNGEQHGYWPAEFAHGAYVPLQRNELVMHRIGNEILSMKSGSWSDWTMKEDLSIRGRSKISTQGDKDCTFEKEALWSVVRKNFETGDYVVTKEKLEALDNSEVTCEMLVERAAPVSVTNGILRIPFPMNPNSIDDLNLLAIAAPRLTPIHIPYGVTEEMNITLHVPANVKLTSPEFSLKKVNAAGTFEYKVAASSDDIEVVKTMTLNSNIMMKIPSDDIRELLALWQDPAHRELIFETK